MNVEKRSTRRGSGRQWRHPAGRLGWSFALVVVLALLGAADANAGFEWLGPESGEFPNKASEVQLFGAAKGVGANYSTGDFYVADGGKNRVLRFDKEGRFLEAWGWGVGDGEAHFERCGPQGEAAFPVCRGEAPHLEERGIAGEGNGEFENADGVAVDQNTGNVFVSNLNGSPGQHEVQEFTPSGEFVRGFATRGTASPEEVEDPEGVGLATDSSGNVYLIDKGKGRGPRVVEYERQISGEYAFKQGLFAAKFTNGQYLSIDAAGRFYLTANSKILRFDSATAVSPSWQISVPETEATTVDPTTGEVYFYAFKQNTFHQVTAVGATERVETTFPGPNNSFHVYGAAFSPTSSIKGHPAGALYVDEETDPVAKKPSRGLIFSPSSTFPPKVDGESVRGVGPTYAKLGGKVDPRGFDAHYRFEYGTAGPCSANPCAEAPAGGADAGAGNGDQPVSVDVGGLSPGTTYFFRLVAENQFGSDHGEDASFTTYPAVAGGLPDGRAYELVSPADKHGGEVIPASPEIGSCHECEPGINSIKMPEQSTPDGESIVYEGFPFFPETEGQRGALKENEYRASRSPAGWQTTDLSVEGETHGFGFRAFTADLARGVLQEKEAPLASGALPLGYEGLYTREADGTLIPLITELRGSVPTGVLQLEYTGGSADLGHLTFEANEPLTAKTETAPAAPAVTGSERDLYEWTREGLRLVNVLPGNGAAAPGSVIGSGKELNAVTEAGPDTSNAVSEDGTKIFWTQLASGKLYERVEGNSTREIAHTGRCRSSVPLSERVCFLTASTDGDRVLLSNGEIVETTQEPVLKVFDLTKNHGGFEGIAGASADLKHVFFVDDEVLNPVAGPAKTVAQPGQPNLYEYEAAAGAVRFIGTLTTFDGAHGVDSMLSTWAPAPTDRLAQVTPDGHFLAFDSTAPLTGYNSDIEGEHCGVAGEPQACSEVFEYEAPARTLRCVSCNPTGQRPAGPSWLSLLQPIVSRFPQPSNLLQNGRVFFDSFDVLTASDHFPGVENVYEFERQGQGSCEELEKGCIELISTGRSELDASFLSADTSGRNVFFTTRQQVLPEEDRDELVDLYDAREGGGFAAPVPPAPCVGEACRPPSPPPPTSSSGGSSTYVGPGNLSPQPETAVKHSIAKHPSPRKCPRGMVRNKHHKCVKKRRKGRTSASHKAASQRHGAAHR